MLIRRIATIIIVELIPFMNELSMIVKTPVTTRAIPPLGLIHTTPSHCFESMMFLLR